MRIEYHPALAGELAEVRVYYNSKVPGLGDEFVDEFERTALRIAATPECWMTVNRDLRRALMRRFPYAILFRILRDGAIRITVVKHERRHPAYGVARR
jgi:plasmid stabilization system protein ParE